MNNRDYYLNKENKLKNLAENFRNVNNIIPDICINQDIGNSTTKSSLLENITKIEKQSKVVYRFDRGVIGINETGYIREIILDGTEDFHGETTRKIGMLEGCVIPTQIDNDPFMNGVIVSQQGELIMQLEGANMFVYLPQIISTQQYQSLEIEVIPRKNFDSIAFFHNNQVYDNNDINWDTLLTFSKTIIRNEKITPKVI